MMWQSGRRKGGQPNKLVSIRHPSPRFANNGHLYFSAGQLKQRTQLDTTTPSTLLLPVTTSSSDPISTALGV